MNLSPVLRKSSRTLRTFAAKYFPEILAGVGISGFLSSIVSTISATSKAKDKIREETEKKGEPLTKKEIFKHTWKYYIPTAVLAGGGAACIVGADTIHYKRNIALATLCTVADTTLADYKEEVGKVLGPKKMEEVEGNVDAKKVERNPPTDSCIMNTGLGNTLMYEPISNYYFRCSIPSVESALVKADSMRNSGEKVRLNDIFYMLNLPECTVGDYVGFPEPDEYNSSIPSTYIYDSLRKSATMTPSGEPCIQVVLGAVFMEDSVTFGSKLL